MFKNHKLIIYPIERIVQFLLHDLFQPKVRLFKKTQIKIFKK